MGTDLVVGGGRLDRCLVDADKLLCDYRTDDGLRYLDWRPTTDPDRLMPEDLAVTILINSRVGPAAFKSVQDRGVDLDLEGLPDMPLAQTSLEVRGRVARLIADVAQWKGFAASVATKVLHKKRPQLIPILDNQAIFGAYMNPRWPERRSLVDSVYAESRIAEALEWIWTDLTRRENADAWTLLSALEPGRSRIELFDMIWWVNFRRIEPVRPASPV
ncbi:DUF6308 family protein [Phytohabitans houttuyneae]|uniref:Uncharacterized protein n=1 Tax=Phytohabitans houttuyneae TaxID=1076126 RepID=A0A6V8KU55_9ACTN|nr:DUF6308 family protein [Phytohabitans houttuyneae]GFJ85839.1 hypothetical protein Phou_100190 [Phytohabitans houttuyneae]